MWLSLRLLAPQPPFPAILRHRLLQRLPPGNVVYEIILQNPIKILIRSTSFQEKEMMDLPWCRTNVKKASPPKSPVHAVLCVHTPADTRGTLPWHRRVRGPGFCARTSVEPASPPWNALGLGFAICAMGSSSLNSNPYQLGDLIGWCLLTTVPRATPRGGGCLAPHCWQRASQSTGH